MRLTDIRSQEDVDEIAGKAVYLEDGQIPEMTLEDDGYAALIGWMVLTPAKEENAVYEVGEITEFFDIPNNPCIEVETENGAVMIPLHEDFILGLDPENREIMMEIPEGLL